MFQTCRFVSFNLVTSSLLVGVFSDSIGQRRRRGRSRRRNILPDLSGDLQGNDYEVRMRRKSAEGQLFELGLTSGSVEQI